MPSEEQRRRVLAWEAFILAYVWSCAYIYYRVLRAEAARGNILALYIHSTPRSGDRRQMQRLDLPHASPAVIIWLGPGDTDLHIA